MNWDSENSSHACLWLFETWYCQQRGEDFETVGGWGVDYIIRLGGGSSGDLSTHTAEAHAAMLDQVFPNLFRATYKAGKNSGTAKAKMKAVLSDSSNKVSDLGPVIDEHYQFLS